MKKKDIKATELKIAAMTPEYYLLIPADIELTDTNGAEVSAIGYNVKTKAVVAGTAAGIFKMLPWLEPPTGEYTKLRLRKVDYEPK